MQSTTDSTSFFDNGEKYTTMLSQDKHAQTPHKGCHPSSRLIAMSTMELWDSRTHYAKHLCPKGPVIHDISIMLISLCCVMAIHIFWYPEDIHIFWYQEEWLSTVHFNRNTCISVNLYSMSRSLLTHAVPSVTFPFLRCHGPHHVVMFSHTVMSPHTPADHPACALVSHPALISSGLLISAACYLVDRLLRISSP